MKPAVLILLLLVPSITSAKPSFRDLPNTSGILTSETQNLACFHGYYSLHVLTTLKKTSFFYKEPVDSIAEDRLQQERALRELVELLFYWNPKDQSLQHDSRQFRIASLLDLKRLGSAVGWSSRGKTEELKSLWKGSKISEEWEKRRLQACDTVSWVLRSKKTLNRVRRGTLRRHPAAYHRIFSAVNLRVFECESTALSDTDLCYGSYASQVTALEDAIESLPSEVVSQVFLALVWSTATSRKDLILYYMGLRDAHPAAFVHSQVMDQASRRMWLSQRFDPKLDCSEEHFLFLNHRKGEIRSDRGPLSLRLNEVYKRAPRLALLADEVNFRSTTWDPYKMDRNLGHLFPIHTSPDRSTKTSDTTQPAPDAYPAQKPDRPNSHEDLPADLSHGSSASELNRTPAVPAHRTTSSNKKPKPAAAPSHHLRHLRHRRACHHHTADS